MFRTLRFYSAQAGQNRGKLVENTIIDKYIPPTGYKLPFSKEALKEYAVRFKQYAYKNIGF
jgi:hypothetical protein